MNCKHFNYKKTWKPKIMLDFHAKQPLGLLTNPLAHPCLGDNPLDGLLDNVVQVALSEPHYTLHCNDFI